MAIPLVVGLGVSGIAAWKLYQYFTSRSGSVQKYHEKDIEASNSEKQLSRKDDLIWKHEFQKDVEYGDAKPLGNIQPPLGNIQPTPHGTLMKPEQQTFISPFLTRKQRRIILEKIKSFRFPNVSVTNCIFEDDHVEFYFVLEGIANVDKLQLIEKITNFLAVYVSLNEKIKLTQLKNKPIGERTYSRPGQPIRNMNAQTTTTLGAFVSIEGIGDHVISCGHDKRVGDILLNNYNEKIGTTNAVVCCTEGGQTYDAAVAKVNVIRYTKSVAVNNNSRRLHLACNPVNPVKGTIVQCFPPQSTVSRATIRHTDYNSLTYDVYGCISVQMSNDGDAFHGPGESGLVMTSVPATEFQETVDPIGMLFFREYVERTDDGRGYFLSLAIPITKNLEKLQYDVYCAGRQIKFLSDR